MGTWISHLRIAERLLEQRPDLDGPLFLIGNVAPDSGRPNADWTVFDPPKTVTHFLNPGEDEGRIRDLEFYREWVRPLDRPDPARSDPARFSFVLGYFTHLVSDNLWMHLVGQPTQQAFAAEFAADRGAAWERVKDDWYGLDHKYLRDHPDNVFARRVVDAPNPVSPLPFLPTEALADRLDDLRTFYREPRGFVLDRAYPYLGEATMDRVVEGSARTILTLLARLEAGDLPDSAPVSLRVLDLPPACALP